MAAVAANLIKREYAALRGKPHSNYFQVYDLVHNNIFEWIVYIIGPPQTMYSGGVFCAIMRFPTEYPMSPPSVQFTSLMWHPNVYGDGKVCISTLHSMPAHASGGGNSDQKDVSSEYWRPVLGVEQALLSVVSLFSDPNCSDPANQVAASQLMKNPKVFEARVKRLCEKSRENLPDDFVLPVVCAAPSMDKLSTNGITSSSSSSLSKTGEILEDGRDLSSLDEESEEYLYSGDEDDEEASIFVFPRPQTLKSDEKAQSQSTESNQAAGPPTVDQNKRQKRTFGDVAQALTKTPSDA
mmetsp:Transcript_13924/g.25777  ORF Transcript_13924/g.25777 Transcript_13924/m.25777 type:complete len:296 (-) Transcript_13924:198-1085(-)